MKTVYPIYLALTFLASHGYTKSTRHDLYFVDSTNPNLIKVWGYEDSKTHKPCVAVFSNKSAKIYNLNPHSESKITLKAKYTNAWQNTVIDYLLKTSSKNALEYCDYVQHSEREM